ncbi:MAG TPA: PAS domain-containing protein [Acetobacteraceae bacterium]|nr:PAS domain-containing protein [Acetobacteraceae bacterium]
MRGLDWAVTPLGPPKRWPQPLRTLVAVMLGSAQPMFVAWGPARIMLYNDAYAPICGTRHPAALGRPFAEVWPDIMAEIGPILDRAFAGESTHMDDIALTLHRNGYAEEAHFAFSYTPVRGEGGAVEGMFCACTETTAQVMAERARRAAEARMRGLLDSITDAFLAMGRDWRFTHVNTEAERLLGRAAADLIGREVWAEYPGLMGSEFEQIYRRAAATGEAGSVTAHYAEHDRWYEVRAYPWADGISVFFRDVTGERRAEAELRESEARLRFLGELDEATRALCDPVEVMAAATRLLRQRLGATRCAYADVDVDGDGFSIREDATAPGHPRSVGTYSLDLFGPRAAADMRGGRTLLVHDVAAELAPGEGRETFLGIGIHAIVCCPLVKAGRLAAMMAVHQAEARAWTPEEVRLIEATVERCWAHVERVGAEARLREGEARFRTLADAMPQMVWSTRPDGFHDYYNARWYAFTGMPEGATDGEGWNDMFHPEDREGAWACWRRSLATGEPYEVEYRLRRHDGAYRWVLGRALPLRDEAGRILRWFGTCTDIDDQKRASEVLARSRLELERLVEARTAELLRAAEERRRAEEAMRQGEKLAALGQLTGGVAHDFNNLLQVVSSGAQLLRRPGLPEGRRTAILDGMVQAGQMARELTNRLLAFARHQPLAPQAFDMNARLAAMSELLRQTLGSGVRVRTELAADLWPVHCDPGQLEVAVLNLAVNARDAMPEGGTLTLRTYNAVLEGAGERQPGDYVCLVVEDTGAGMPPAVLARVFEPFFTTKAVGKGSGLGLPQVFGFARQSGGDVVVESEPGRGTAVALHLPRAKAGAQAPEPGRGAVVEAMQSSAGQTVLVVEDNEQAGDFAAQLLEELGYRTLHALDAEEALAMLGADPRGIDAVFSDIVMPGRMGGMELAAVVRRAYPHVAVLLATGYSALLATEGAPEGVEVLTKPYRLDHLAAALARGFANRAVDPARGVVPAPSAGR